MSSPAVFTSPNDRFTGPISESAGTSRPSDSYSPILMASPSTTSSPKSLSPSATPSRTPRESLSPPSASHPLPQSSLSAAVNHTSAFSLAGHLSDLAASSFRSRSRSPLGQIDDTLSTWRASQAQDAPGHKSPSTWWIKNEHQGKNLQFQDPLPGWQQTRSRVARAVSSVLGPTITLAHEALYAGVELLELAPLPGLAPAARTLLEIWDALGTVDMNRAASLRLTERCADILLSVREDIKDAGDVIGDDLTPPVSKLIESFSLVYDLLHKLNHRPFLKRYLKRDDILRQISECDKALTDALSMFSISIQLRILRQVQASELQRKMDTRAILDTLVHATSPSNALLLTGVENPPSALPGPSHASLSSPPSYVDSPTQPVDSDTQLPALIIDEVDASTSSQPPHVLPALREIQTRQNTTDAEKDLTDLRRLLSAAILTSKDAQMLEVLQVGRDEMPEAMKTLQRALEKIIERETSNGRQIEEPVVTKEVDANVETADRNPRQSFMARRMTLKSFNGRRSSMIKRSKTEGSSDSNGTNGTSNQSTVTGRTRDTLDREFIESGLDALRRMSQSGEYTLPSWTITRYEVDREEKIGVGFFSDVYKGKWRGRTVAIKVLAETTPRKLFVHEAEIWKSLHHPHVLELYGASSTSCDPPWFFVSPYAKNGSLPDYLRRLASEPGPWNLALSPSASSSSVRRTSPTRDSLLGSSLTGNFTGRADRPLSLSDVQKEWDLYRFMHEIAKGMEYLHNVKVIRGDVEITGVLHGDLKAANVLVDDRYHCVISDFGQSEMKSEAYRISGTPLPHGTLRWQAPELMVGASDLTPAMDVYAFAIACIEVLLMGRIPWHLYGDDDVRRFVLDEDRRPHLPELPPFSSTALCELLQDCWSRDPMRRPTFTQIVHRLRLIRRNAGQNPDETQTPRRSEQLDIERTSQHSPEMRPAPLPNDAYSRSSEETRLHHASNPRIRIEDTVANERVHHPDHVMYTSSAPSSRPSSLFSHPSSSEESVLLTHHHDGYESPLLHDDRIVDRKHEMRYRMLLNHDFHPSLTLPLWQPTHVKLGAVGYLSKPDGRFVTLFNSFTPHKASEEDTKNIPSLHGYGKVEVGMQRQDKRNVAQRGIDMIAGLITFRNAESRSIGRRYSFPLRSGHKVAYLCAETTIYRYMESLDVPKRWLTANVDRILKIYAPRHPISKENIFLVIGALNTPDYALFVSHKHPDGQVHFNVYAAPRNGQPWGAFTTDTQVSPKIGGPVYHEALSVTPSSASRVSAAGEGWNSVILARLRFKPDIPEPTSL
ncbi:hypothetical protein APHAL10511_004054 [Amanita phalloides]|nr:hypothetical protein APHAL10511_004054 [Amanita phalloides]